MLPDYVGELMSCDVDLSTAQGDLAICQGDLATCQASQQDARLLKTGQTKCWNSSGNVVPCAGTRQDGELQKGLALAYTDNGDGTITDNRTGLTWEKLSAGDGSIHDWANLYTWDQAFAVHVAGLNSASFAGHNDWRLPNVKELQSILNYNLTYSPMNYNQPLVSPAFNTVCSDLVDADCPVTTCSCADALPYWTSTTSVSFPTKAYVVDFGEGLVRTDYGDKVQFHLGARAVRGGF